MTGEAAYLNLLHDVIMNGVESDDRTGTGTYSVFGRQIRFDLSKGFPLLTTKKVFWKGIVIELLWLMKGSTNIKFLQEHGVKIWDEWADENGDLGPVYGQQWRQFKSVRPGGQVRSKDQLKEVIKQIKENPNSRRIMVSAWNPVVVDDMALPPCHTFFQFYVRNGKLSCQLYQRSADLFLGVPFNIASYALLTHLIARECGLEVGEFVHTFGDAHIYKNHVEQVLTQLRRNILQPPKLKFRIIKPGELMDFIDNKVDTLSWQAIKDRIHLEGYNSHPAIKAPVSV